MIGSIEGVNMFKEAGGQLYVAILAAGQGKRMKSSRPKVLHYLLGRTLLDYVLKLAESIVPDDIYLIVGHNREQIMESYKSRDIKFVIQEEQLGTGHAITCLREEIEKNGDVTLVVLSGDVPLIKQDTLKRMLSLHREEKAVVTLLGARVKRPDGLGRLVLDENNHPKYIIEEKDANLKELGINLINVGCYCFKVPEVFELLDLLKPENKQNEYYVTDVVRIARQKGLRVRAIVSQDELEAVGINSRSELAKTTRILLNIIINKWMERGVTFIMPETVYIEDSVELSPDCVIWPYCILKGDTKLETGVTIEAGVNIKDSYIGKDVVIGTGAILDNVTISSGDKITPYSLLKD